MKKIENVRIVDIHKIYLYLGVVHFFVHVKYKLYNFSLHVYKSLALVTQMPCDDTTVIEESLDKINIV